MYRFLHMGLIHTFLAFSLLNPIALGFPIRHLHKGALGYDEVSSVVPTSLVAGSASRIIGSISMKMFHGSWLYSL